MPGNQQNIKIFQVAMFVNGEPGRVRREETNIYQLYSAFSRLPKDPNRRVVYLDNRSSKPT